VQFTDGQGMGGMRQVMKAVEQEGYSFLSVGVGPQCKAVTRFEHNGLYARNLVELAGKLPAAALKAWEAAGRVVAG
jgi:hypothetical protein